MVRRSLPLLLISIAVLAACAGGGEPAVEESAESTTYTVRGMFARAEDEVTMTVRHEEITGYMASMTMPFKVADAALIEGLAYGDKIEFELEVGGQGAVVRSVTKLPEDTVLSFEVP
jgi:Cu/Ag efflux protein CusF